MDAWYEKNREQEQQRALRWYHEHRDRALANQKRWHQENRAVVNRKRVLRKYGLTIEKYDSMIIEQGGGCAICGGPPIGKNGRAGYFSVDHDHDTNEVRGLLCDNCNIMLGHAKSDPDLLRKAAAYLESFNVR